MLPRISAMWDRASAVLDRKDASVCAGMVFYLGVLTVSATDLAFYAAYPEYFERSVPTISRAGSFAPANYVFATGMVLVAVCIFVTWSLARRTHRDWIARLVRDPAQAARLRMLNESAAYAGCFAGFCLGTMGVISLEVSNFTHMALSWGFFVSQILAFILDTKLSLTLRRISRSRQGVRTYEPNGRHLVCLTVCVFGLIFLFMFYAKDAHVFADRMVAQWIFVTCEHIVAFFSFYYSLRFQPLGREYVRARSRHLADPEATPAGMAPIPVRTNR